jgi:hypothetical protein
VFEGGVRSNSFLWGPGVLPPTAAGATFDGIFHLVDYYSTFAAIAGVNTDHTGPPGFDQPDGMTSTFPTQALLPFFEQMHLLGNTSWIQNRCSALSVGLARDTLGM